MNVMELLTSAVEQNAADIFLIPGMPFSYKIGGRIIYQGDNRIMPDEMDKMITEIYGLAKNRDMDKVQSHGDDDFSLPSWGVAFQGQCVPPEGLPGRNHPGGAF